MDNGNGSNYVSEKGLSLTLWHTLVSPPQMNPWPSVSSSTEQTEAKRRISKHLYLQRSLSLFGHSKTTARKQSQSQADQGPAFCSQQGRQTMEPIAEFCWVSGIVSNAISPNRSGRCQGMLDRGTMLYNGTVGSWKRLEVRFLWQMGTDLYKRTLYGFIPADTVSRNEFDTIMRCGILLRLVELALVDQVSCALTIIPYSSQCLPWVIDLVLRMTRRSIAVTSKE